MFEIFFTILGNPEQQGQGGKRLSKKERRELRLKQQKEKKAEGGGGGGGGGGGTKPGGQGGGGQAAGGQKQDIKGISNASWKGQSLGELLTFELDGGMRVEPQNPFPFLGVILAEKGTRV